MKRKPTISIIAAIAKNRAIGKNNQLLWHIPEDLQHFKKVTENHPVIMGQKTFYSIGRPLPRRENIILTYDKELQIDGCHIVYSIEEAIDLASKFDDEEVFVIGGGMVYKETLPIADKLYLTLVEGEFEADVFFPEYEDIFTNKISEEHHKNGQYEFTFIELVRGDKDE